MFYIGDKEFLTLAEMVKFSKELISKKVYHSCIADDMLVKAVKDKTVLIKKISYCFSRRHIVINRRYMVDAPIDLKVGDNVKISVIIVDDNGWYRRG